MWKKNWGRISEPRDEWLGLELRKWNNGICWLLQQQARTRIKSIFQAVFALKWSFVAQVRDEKIKHHEQNKSFIRWKMMTYVPKHARRHLSCSGSSVLHQGALWGFRKVMKIVCESAPWANTKMPCLKIGPRTLCFFPMKSYGFSAHNLVYLKEIIRWYVFVEFFDEFWSSMSPCRELLIKNYCARCFSVNHTIFCGTIDDGTVSHNYMKVSMSLVMSVRFHFVAWNEETLIIIELFYYAHEYASQCTVCRREIRPSWNLCGRTAPKLSQFSTSYSCSRGYLSEFRCTVIQSWNHRTRLR